MKDPEVYLLHINDAIGKVLQYTAKGKENFLEDSKTQDAVIRNLEIIGEATKKISDDFKSKYPDIAWKEVSGMRDVLIHDYFGVNLDIVWEVVERDIPQLQEKINVLLDDQ